MSCRSSPYVPLDATNSRGLPVCGSPGGSHGPEGCKPAGVPASAWCQRHDMTQVQPVLPRSDTGAEVERGGQHPHNGTVVKGHFPGRP
ncbi:uncharacterized protein LOC144156159 isoform X2 [Haemaphysalis longicornis]